MKHTALSVVILAASFAQGQSFKETLRWMHNASEYNVSSDPTKGDFDWVEVPLTNTCTNFVITLEHDGETKHTFKAVLNLRTIDPNTIRALGLEEDLWTSVYIGTTDDQSAIQTENTTSIGRKTKGVSFPFDASFAPRFVKALRHAVILCGGKPSKF